MRGVKHRRRRSALRLAARAAFSAVIGAAATVLVAWGLAMAPRLDSRVSMHAFKSHRPPGEWGMISSASLNAGIGVVYVDSSPPTLDQHGDFLLRESSPAMHDFVPSWALPHVRQHWSAYSDSYLILEATGWPAVSAYSITHLQPSGALITRGDLVLNRWRVRRPILIAPVPAVLPVHAIGRGFLVNTAFYGWVAFIVWSVPGFVRRRVRRRRGRCAACGYELKELAVCPECGGGGA